MAHSVVGRGPRSPTSSPENPETSRATSAHPETVAAVLADQIFTQHRSTAAQLPVFVGLFFVVFWWAPLSRPWLLVWAVVSVMLIAVCLRTIRRVPPEADEHAKLRAVTAANAYAGFAAGLLTYLALPETQLWQLIVVSLNAFFLVVNVLDSAAIRSVFLAFHVPATVLPLLGFWMHGGGFARVTSPMLLTASAMVCLFSTGVRTAQTERAELALANASLVRELVGANEELARLSWEDGLTGIANRRHFDEYLRVALEADSGRRQRLVALVLLDLDRFKPVNDELGHDVGDQLLVAVTRRLAARCPEESLLARIGGDEFVVCVPALDAPGEPGLDRLCARLLAAFEDPFILDQLSVSVSASVGASFAEAGAEHDGSTAAHRLYRAADQAMYAMKRTEPAADTHREPTNAAGATQ